MDTASLGEGKFLLAVPDLKLGFESLAHLVRRNIAVRFDGHPQRIDRRHVGLEVTELLMLRRPNPTFGWLHISPTDTRCIMDRLLSDRDAAVETDPTHTGAAVIC